MDYANQITMTESTAVVIREEEWGGGEAEGIGSGEGGEAGERVNPVAQKTFWRWLKSFLSWLWWQFHKCTHTLKLIKLHTLNMFSLLYGIYFLISVCFLKNTHTQKKYCNIKWVALKATKREEKSARDRTKKDLMFTMYKELLQISKKNKQTQKSPTK